MAGVTKSGVSKRESTARSNRADDIPYVCPMRQAIGIIGDRWVALILRELGDEPKRFMDIRRQVPDITQKMLTQTLRKLERDGIVIRKVYAEVPPKVEYQLTNIGRSLREAMAPLREWARHYQKALSEARMRYDAK